MRDLDVKLFQCPMSRMKFEMKQETVENFYLARGIKQEPTAFFKLVETGLLKKYEHSYSSEYLSAEDHLSPHSELDYLTPEVKTAAVSSTATPLQGGEKLPDDDGEMTMMMAMMMTMMMMMMMRVLAMKIPKMWNVYRKLSKKSRILMRSFTERLRPR